MQISTPRSGENFGAVAALVKPPAAVAAPPRASEKLRAAGFFFEIGLYLRVRKHQNRSDFMYNENGDAANTRAPLEWAPGFHFRFIFLSFSTFFYKKNEKMNRTTPN